MVQHGKCSVKDEVSSHYERGLQFVPRSRYFPNYCQLRYMWWLSAADRNEGVVNRKALCEEFGIKRSDAWPGFMADQDGGNRGDKNVRHHVGILHAMR